MTRDQVISEIEDRLGRSLTEDEVAYVDLTLEIRRGAVNTADIPMMVRDIQRGNREGTAPVDLVPETEPEEAAEPTIFDRPIPEEPVGSILDLPGQLGSDPEQARQPIPQALISEFHAAAVNAGVPVNQIYQQLDGYFQSVTSFPESADAVLAEMRATIDELKSGTMGARPIGVADDFVAQRRLQTPTSALTGGANFAGIQEVEPRYFDGDEFSPAGLAPDEIARIQTRLENAGLLEPGGYWAGMWDGLTSNAYKGALGMANQSGRDVNDTIDHLVATLPESIKEQRARAEAAKAFQAAPYMRPDRDALAQDVKEAFRSRLGREPTSEDLAWGVSAFGNEYRQQYESEVAAARMMFNAGEDGTGGGGVVQGVDPAASFREQLEQRFGPEIDRLGSLDDVRENMTNVFASLRTMGNMVGGSPGQVRSRLGIRG